MKDLLDMSLPVRNNAAKKRKHPSFSAAQWEDAGHSPIEAAQGRITSYQTSMFRSPQIVDLENMTREAYRAQESAKPWHRKDTLSE